jgi:hypothetical protein
MIQLHRTSIIQRREGGIWTEEEGNEHREKKRGGAGEE